MSQSKAQGFNDQSEIICITGISSQFNKFNFRKFFFRNYEIVNLIAFASPYQLNCTSKGLCNDDMNILWEKTPLIIAFGFNLSSKVSICFYFIV